MEKKNDSEEKKKLTRVYEIGYNIIPTVAVENLSNEVENLKNFLVKEGAVIVSEEFPKIRNLAYSMFKLVGGAKRRFDTAYFGWIKFDAGESSMAKIKKFLDGNESVLRFLLIKTVRESTLFSPISPKIPLPTSKGELKAVKKDSAEKEIKSPISQEELDRTIDKLIAE